MKITTSTPVEFYKWVLKNEYQLNNNEQRTHTVEQLYFVFLNEKRICRMEGTKLICFCGSCRKTKNVK